MRRVCISDSYNMTSNCLMNQELGVMFLKNPIIKVLKWRMTKDDNNTKSLHIMEFITVKNSVSFPVLGNPTNLQSIQLLSTTTFEENVEKCGVLIPGRAVNNIIDKIMKNIKNHLISVSDK